MTFQTTGPSPLVQLLAWAAIATLLLLPILIGLTIRRQWVALGRDLGRPLRAPRVSAITDPRFPR